MNLSETALFDQVREAGPRFLPAHGSASTNPALSRTCALNSSHANSPLSSIYQVFHEYVDSRDCGNGGVSTYKAIHGFSRSIGDAATAETDKAFDAATVVAPTIALSMPVEKYTRGGKRMVRQGDRTRIDSWVMDKDDELVKVLFASHANTPQKKRCDIVQCNYDPVSGAIELALCSTGIPVDAGNPKSGGICVPRLWMKGNSLTHTFQLKGILCSPCAASATELLISFAAAGMARGSGEYMIFRFVCATPGESHHCYYKIRADATEEDLFAVLAACPNGMSPSEATAADTMGHIANLPATLFTPTHGGRRLTDYANGNVLTPLP